MNDTLKADKKREYRKEYYQLNKERIKAKSAEYRQLNSEQCRAAVRKWHASPENAERLLQSKKQYYQNNRDKIIARSKARIVDPIAESERQRVWRTTHKDKHCAKNAKYRASRRKRTPGWLTDDDQWMIAEIYELAARRSRTTGIEWHVDHIIPLNGKTVSGLHVPENMQVIPAALNFRKHNLFV